MTEARDRVIVPRRRRYASADEDGRAAMLPRCTEPEMRRATNCKSHHSAVADDRRADQGEREAGQVNPALAWKPCGWLCNPPQPGIASDDGP